MVSKVCQQDLPAESKSRTRLLTRDRGLLKHSAVIRGYWLRETDSRRQVAEVVSRFDLARLLRPFTRCMVCNQDLHTGSRSEVRYRAPGGRARHSVFYSPQLLYERAGVHRSYEHETRREA
jgi:uncharacterized protein with PIN domain